MGRQSHKSMPYMCGACKQGFMSEQAVRDHVRSVHAAVLRVGIFRRIDRVDGPEYEQSYGERAVAAEQAIAAGEHTDDAWLLGK